MLRHRAWRLHRWDPVKHSSLSLEKGEKMPDLFLIYSIVQLRLVWLLQTCTQDHFCSSHHTDENKNSLWVSTTAEWVSYKHGLQILVLPRHIFTWSVFCQLTQMRETCGDECWECTLLLTRLTWMWTYFYKILVRFWRGAVSTVKLCTKKNPKEILNIQIHKCTTIF